MSGTESSLPPGLVVATTAVRSSLVASVSDLDHVSFDLEVVGTNLFLAAILMFLIGTSSALFNATLDENRAAIEGAVGRMTARVGVALAPLAVVARRVGLVSPTHRATGVARLVFVLLATALIYGFLDPEFGLDPRSAIVFVALVVGLGVVTYITEGGSAVVSQYRYHVPSGVRVFGVALVIAVASVVISRVIDFRPGILYGFVASAVLLTPTALGRREDAEVRLVPILTLLAASLAAWLLLVPLRAAGAPEGSWLVGLVEAIAAIVFVVGLETVFFSLIPIEFMDGAAIAQWSRAVWVVVFGLAGFLFWHLLLHQDKSYLAAFAETRVLAAFGLVAIFSIATLGTWTYFHFSRREATA